MFLIIISHTHAHPFTHLQHPRASQKDKGQVTCFLPFLPYCCFLRGVHVAGFFLIITLFFFFKSLNFFLSFNGFALLIYFIYYIYFFILFTALGFKIFVVAFFLNQDKNMILSKLNYNKLDRYFE